MERYYDRDGSPMTMMDWARSFDDTTKKRVARDVVGDAEVSTVWLGLNHQYDPNGPPLIFETMVFGGEHSQWQDRYTTEAEAVAGHQRVVANLKAGLAPDA